MRRLIASALLIVALSGCASSRTGRLLNVAVVGSATADYLTTRQAIESGRGREGNWFGNSALHQALVKSAGTTGIIGLAALADLKGKPVVAHVVRGMAIAAWSVIAARNYQFGR